MSNPLTLPEVVQLFAAWREERLSHRELVPNRLWAAASSLVGRGRLMLQITPHQVTRYLRTV